MENFIGVTLSWKFESISGLTPRETYSMVMQFFQKWIGPKANYSRIYGWKMVSIMNLKSILIFLDQFVIIMEYKSLIPWIRNRTITILITYAVDNLQNVDHNLYQISDRKSNSLINLIKHFKSSCHLYVLSKFIVQSAMISSIFFINQENYE